MGRLFKDGISQETCQKSHSLRLSRKEVEQQEIDLLFL